jgi:hypothetical protein
MSLVHRTPQSIGSAGSSSAKPGRVLSPVGVLAGEHPERLDLIGASLVTAGVVALVWALTRANGVGWASAEVVGTQIGGSEGDRR